jgi:hypothetical protein
VDWGIIYWRQNPVDSLPRINLPDVPIDPSLLMFPTHDLLQLTEYVDAAHATDLKTRRSGYVFTLAGGAVTFESKLQATVATSSTEAGFVAAVSAAKVAKYLRSVILELGFGQGKPTPLYVDNQAEIVMVNERKQAYSPLLTHPYPTLCNTRVESRW